MVTLPLVVVLGLLAFGLVKWGKQKLSGVLVGSCSAWRWRRRRSGPPILHAVTAGVEDGGLRRSVRRCADEPGTRRLAV